MFSEHSLGQYADKLRRGLGHLVPFHECSSRPGSTDTFGLNRLVEIEVPFPRNFLRGITGVSPPQARQLSLNIHGELTKYE